MYRVVLLSCIAAAFLSAQEKNTHPRRRILSEHIVATTRVKSVVPSNTYSASEIRVLGDLDYGRSSGSVRYAANPPYSAFVFSAFGGETVEISVKGGDRKAMVALADSSLNRLAIGDTSLRVSLPNRGPYIECWYIVFRDFEKKPANFTVQVNKLTPGAPDMPAATATAVAAIE